jgi:hypothetical protein
MFVGEVRGYEVADRVSIIKYNSRISLGWWLDWVNRSDPLHAMPCCIIRLCSPTRRADLLKTSSDIHPASMISVISLSHRYNQNPVLKIACKLYAKVSP